MPRLVKTDEEINQNRTRRESGWERLRRYFTRLFAPSLPYDVHEEATVRIYTPRSLHGSDSATRRLY